MLYPYRHRLVEFYVLKKYCESSGMNFSLWMKIQTTWTQAFKQAETGSLSVVQKNNDSVSVMNKYFHNLSSNILFSIPKFTDSSRRLSKRWKQQHILNKDFAVF